MNMEVEDIIHMFLQNNDIYLCGSSINYIGYRGSTIIMMNDDDTKKIIMNKVLNIINN